MTRALWAGLIWLAMAGGVARADPVAAAGLKVMSYNVNYGLAGDQDTLDAIADADADLVLLQETTARWEEPLRRQLGERYPHIEFHHVRRSPGGLAVLSKFPFASKAYLDAPSGWFPAWRGVVDGPFGPVQVLHVHLRPAIDNGSWVRGWFTTRKIRRVEIEAYHQALDPALPSLVVGDFNEPADGLAVAFLAEHGFASALARFAPRAPTWRWQTRAGMLRLQLDHILHDARLEAVDGRVVDRGRSDHLPVVAIVRAAAVR